MSFQMACQLCVKKAALVRAERNSDSSEVDETASAARNKAMINQQKQMMDQATEQLSQLMSIPDKDVS